MTDESVIRQYRDFFFYNINTEIKKKRS